MKKKIDQEVGVIKNTLGELTDEIADGRIIHHVDGNAKNKFVLGSVRSGKSPLKNICSAIKARNKLS